MGKNDYFNKKIKIKKKILKKINNDFNKILELKTYLIYKNNDYFSGKISSLNNEKQITAIHSILIAENIKIIDLINYIKLLVKKHKLYECNKDFYINITFINNKIDITWNTGDLSYLTNACCIN